MSEHRTVVLQNTETLEQVTTTAKVKDLPHERLANVEADYAEEATVLQAAEAALVAYRKEHGGDYIVVDIRRGEADS